MDLNERDLEIFIEASERFFSVLVAEPVTTGEARILFSVPETLDFTGWISVSGVANGVFCVTGNSDVLGSMLGMLDEPENDDELKADLIGELAGTVVMNAREHFGERLKVASPKVYFHAVGLAWPDSPVFEIPLVWREYELLMLIAIERAEV